MDNASISSTCVVRNCFLPSWQVRAHAPGHPDRGRKKARIRMRIMILFPYAAFLPPRTSYSHLAPTN
jgi:hypothetical protein